MGNKDFRSLAKTDGKLLALYTLGSPF